MEVLEVLNGSKSGYSIAYLAQHLSLPPSTVHRLLQTFCVKKYVVKDAKSHEYKLGPALISLGITARNNLHLQDFAKPILEKLAKETSDDAYLAILSGYKGLILEHINGPHPLRILETFGFELDLHCGAIRKALLAYQPDEFVKRYIKTVIKGPQPFPKTDAQTLRDILFKIKSEGVAISRSDYIRHAVGVGAPIFDVDGKVSASIGIISHESKLPEDGDLTVLVGAVKSAARELSAMMGYSIQESAGSEPAR
jgi:DNA-binding IclR family transcriptional regulator